MIKLSNDDIRRHHSLYLDGYKKAEASFLESNYVSKTFPILEAAANRQYPYQVKLPKSMHRLLKGDFEPERIITIDKPIAGVYSNMWFGDATSRCTLRCGYVDGNSSKLCQQTIGAEDIHMVLGGATGQGKSVTLNAIIFGMCMEFAPWEVDLTLIDAKIVEFKSYALQHPMPHIRRIAATEDADYIISVLATLRDEMQQWNSVFPLAGVKKIDDFRKVTGLCIPQHIIVIDEFQTMFQNAKKRVKEITDILLEFSKLGRSTGFHLILASQELGSDLPKDALSNIKIRAAMGCDAHVSELILGNDEAKNNKGRRGRMIINNALETGKLGNVQIRVPFMPDDQRINIGTRIIDAAKELGYQTVLSFYDAEASVDENEYQDYLKSFENRNNILLGEPSFVKEGEQIVSLEMTGKDIENLLVLAPALNNQERYFKMLKANMNRLTTAQSLIVCLNDSFLDWGAEGLASNNMFSDKKSFDNDVLNVAFNLIARRKLCIAIDRLVFSSSSEINDNENFYKEFTAGSDMDTDLNKRRFAAGLYLLNSDAELHKAFGLDLINSADDRAHRSMRLVSIAINTMKNYGCKDVVLEKKDLPPLFVWILGMDRMLGLGRDTKTINVNKFKKNLQDCTEMNIRFIVFSSTLTDLSDLNSGFRWVITDRAAQRDLSALKISDDYPDQVGKNLAVLSDLLAANDKCVKFKKMRLNDENF